MNKRRILIQSLRILGILLLFDLAQVLCAGVWWYVSDLDARTAMSSMLNIAPSWRSLEEHIETSLEVGMTRDEVLEQADKVGYVNINYFFIGERYCEVYSFSVGPFNSTRGGRWGLCYDQNDKVISIEQMLRQ